MSRVVCEAPRDPHRICLLFERLPDAEIRVGLELRIGDIVLGTIVAAWLLEGGNILVKLETKP